MLSANVGDLEILEMVTQIHTLTKKINKYRILFEKKINTLNVALIEFSVSSIPISYHNNEAEQIEERFYWKFM